MPLVETNEEKVIRLFKEYIIALRKDDTWTDQDVRDVLEDNRVTSRGYNYDNLAQLLDESDNGGGGYEIKTLYHLIIDVVFDYKTVSLISNDHQDLVSQLNAFMNSTNADNAYAGLTQRTDYNYAASYGPGWWSYSDLWQVFL